MALVTVTVETKYVLLVEPHHGTSPLDAARHIMGMPHTGILKAIEVPEITPLRYKIEETDNDGGWEEQGVEGQTECVSYA